MQKIKKILNTLTNDDFNRYRKPAEIYPQQSLYHDHLLGQYSAHINEVIWLNNRRGTSHRLFITLCTGLFSLNALLLSGNLQILHTNWARLISSLLGLAICIPWFVLLVTYKRVIETRITIITKMEVDLPYKGYSELYSGDSNFLSIISIETSIPAIFLIGFTLLTSYNLYALLKNV